MTPFSDLFSRFPRSLRAVALLLPLLPSVPLARAGAAPPGRPEGDGGSGSPELVSESPAPGPFEMRARLLRLSQSPKVPVPAAVSRFYSCLSRIHEARDENELYELQTLAEECFLASDQSGLQLTVDGAGMMTSTLYVQSVARSLYSNPSVFVNYHIDRSEIVGEDSTFCVTYVTKILVEGDTDVPYTDILVTRLSDPDHIISFTNRRLGAVTTTADLFPSFSPDRIADASADQLTAWGEIYSYRELYDDAEKCYRELLRRTPDDPRVRKALMALRLRGR